MRPARRLIVALLCLAAFDPFVPALQRRAERQRYEGGQAFRFENSDLFALGPLVSYLRDHPRGERPRTLFLGNSVIFGFGLDAGEAIPGRFQSLHPGTQVFNAAVNGFELGSSYLVSKAVVESVDRFYVMRGAPVAHPLLASMIPVEPADIRLFRLQTPDPLEARLQSMAEAWRLYAATYRLQAAWYGTSTRQYIHLQADALRRAVSGDRQQQASATHASRDGVVEVMRRRSAVPPGEARRAELRRRDEMLWTFADLMAAHRKRAVILQFGGAANGAAGEAEIADFNAAFAPFAELVVLRIPPALLYDGRHVTAIGAQRVAEALTP